MHAALFTEILPMCMPESRSALLLVHIRRCPGPKALATAG